MATENGIYIRLDCTIMSDYISQKVMGKSKIKAKNKAVEINKERQLNPFINVI